MHFKHHLQALFAGSLILTLAFTTVSSTPPSHPLPVSPPVLSTATPTITANLANPVISSQFQLGVNNGLRTLCLGPQSSNQLPENHASTASPSRALTSIMQQLQPSSAATAAESLSTVTQVTTEATAYKTDFLKISTVTAWIDVFSFLDVGSGTQAGTSFGARASLGIEERARENEEIVVTITRTQLATHTAVVKEVPVTALIYVLSYPDPSLTDAPDTTADPNPALRAGNGTNMSQNPSNQQAASQYQAEMLQAFKDGYELGKGMENPCLPAPVPAVGAVGKREDVWKDLGDGVLDVLGVGPDDTGSGKKLRRHRDGLEKRRGSSGGRGGSRGSRGSGTAPVVVVVSAALSATHTTALHNLWITALVIGFLILRAGASTAGFSDNSSSVLSTSIGPKASDPSESLPSNSSSIITDTSRSPTDLRLDSLTSQENRKGGGSAAAARAAAANNNPGATVRPSTTPVRILLVVALLFVLFTTRVTAGTTAHVGSVVVDNLAVTQDTSATVTETLESREVDATSTEVDTAPSSLGGGLGNNDEGKKKHHGGSFTSTGASPRSTAPAQWVFWIIVLVTSLTTSGANALNVHPDVNSNEITEPVYTVDKSVTRFASPNQSLNHETKRITNKSSTPFIAARQHLSGRGYDITPSNVNGPGYHIEPNQLCSAEYNYNCGDASSAAGLPIKLSLLPLYFLFGWGFVGAAGSAITTARDTTDFLDLEDTSPTYPPSDICIITTLLPAFVSGTGSPDTEMNARDTKTTNARPTKHVHFLLPNESPSSSAREKRYKQDMTKVGEGRSLKPKPKPKDNAIRRPRSYSAPTPHSILTTASIAPSPNGRRSSYPKEKQRTHFRQDLIKGGEEKSPKPKPKDNATRRPRSYSAPTLPTPRKESPSSSAGEKQKTRYRQDLIKGGEGKTMKPKPKDNATRRPRSYSAPSPASSVLTTASIALIFAISIGGCTALPSLSATGASSSISLPTHILRSVDTGLPSSTALAHREEQAKNVHNSDTEKHIGGKNPNSSCPKACSSLIWPFLPLLLMLLGCTASATSISMEASSTPNRPTSSLSPTTDTKLASFTVSASDTYRAKRAQDSDTEKLGGAHPHGCPHGCPHSSSTKAPLSSSTKAPHSSSTKARSTSLIWPSLPLLLNLINYITGATGSDSASTLEPLPTNSAEPCEDGLYPSPIDSPLNATNDQQAGTLQAAQAAEGFPVTPDTTSNTTDTPIARRVATVATLQTTPKATRSRIPSLRLLFGVLALFFATQTSALTLGSSAMARRTLPDIHARSNLPERSAMEPEPEPVPVIQSRILEMSETVVSRSDSYFEYCVQMTDEDAKEDCYEYISVEYGLEKSETVAFRSDSRVDDWVQIPGEGEEEGEGCFEDIDDGVEGVDEEAVHGSLAVRSTTEPVSHPRTLKRSDTTASESDPQLGNCDSLDTAEERKHCRDHTDHASRTEGPENLQSRDYSPEGSCRQRHTEEERNTCLESISNGIGAQGIDPNVRKLAVRSTPTPMPGPTLVTPPPTPDTPQMTDDELICNSRHTKKEREACLASVAECNKKPTDEERADCHESMFNGGTGRMSRRRNLDRPEIVARWGGNPGLNNPCAQLTGEDKERCDENVKDFVISGSNSGTQKRDSTVGSALESALYPRNLDAAETIASRSNPVTATGEDMTQDAEELPGSKVSTSGHGIHRRDGDGADDGGRRLKIIIGVVVGVAVAVFIAIFLAARGAGGGGGCGCGGCDGFDCSC